jgi:ASC-1-like (ASCH) protein
MSSDQQIYKVGLQPKYFEMVKTGKKTGEVRPLDSKYRNFKVGDRIIFESDGQVLGCRVTGVKGYKLFDEDTKFEALRKLYEDFLEVAMPHCQTAEEAVSELLEAVPSYREKMKSGAVIVFIERESLSKEL